MGDLFYFMMIPFPVKMDKPRIPEPSTGISRKMDKPSFAKNMLKRGRKIKMKLPTDEYVNRIRKGGLTYDDAVESILEKNGITAPPIGIISIARNMKFDVFSVQFKDKNVAGLMLDSDEKVGLFDSQRVIAVNKDDYTTRRQFTVAHEIGHFVLHCNDQSNFYERYLGEDADTDNKELERQANFFAACLLMPAKMVRKLYQEYKMVTPVPTKSDFADQISEVFVVSPNAASRRIEELSLTF